MLKIEQIISDFTNASCNEVFLANKILSWMREAVEGSLLSEEEIDRVVKEHRDTCIPWDRSFVEAGAQTQLQATLKALEE